VASRTIRLIQEYSGRIDPIVPGTASIRERLTEEAEQLQRLAKGARER
jgi:hypothetical protein